ncbi:uncharacterized protein LOC119400035 [Rhipicephalus sanguineus]|uniref:uncharacterized protein LOC119400035 n=1 Tax=Rhipicephalus sanguineus TaxID=34632 RepID=UPI0020C4131D|nr:uncharacterized protein LOC119400035 [Rhipicephalus sanguineus]
MLCKRLFKEASTISGTRRRCTPTGHSIERQPSARKMARNSKQATVHLSMNESVSDLVNRLRFPEAVGELVLSNCIATEPAELCEQIGRCAALRLLRCVSSVLRPSQLLQLTLGKLPRLERLELSLVADAAVDSEIGNVREMASQSEGVTPSHDLREMYVEVGGDRNFDLLQELLKFYPKLTELHVHFVRGYLSESVVRCYRIVEELPGLETFTFTSELAASLPTPDVPWFSGVLTVYAAMCDNFRHERSCASKNIFELDKLRRRTGTVFLPSQLVVLAVADSDLWGDCFSLASSRKVWTNVRELCFLLLQPNACVEFHQEARSAYCGGLKKLFRVVRESIAELNLSSFHFPLDFDLASQLGVRLPNLNAFSVPPCAFPSHSDVRRFEKICPRLQDLDVRLEKRRGHFRCRSCELLRDQPPSRAAASSSSRNSGIARLTLCGVPSNVLRWFVECYGAAVKLRLAEWSPVESLQCSDLLRLLGKKSAVHCLVLKHQHLPISDEHLQANLFRLTSLQHLCLLTSMQISDVDASKFAHEIAACARGLKCVHMHYRRDDAESEKRVTWLRGQHELEPLLDRPCFGCCSTATFIGLLKPVNRKCDADL